MNFGDTGATFSGEPIPELRNHREDCRLLVEGLTGFPPHVANDDRLDCSLGLVLGSQRWVVGGSAGAMVLWGVLVHDKGLAAHDLYSRLDIDVP